MSATTWENDRNKTALLTGPVHTGRAVFGLEEIQLRKDNANVKTTPIFLTSNGNSDYDIHASELNLKKNGDYSYGRLSSLNGILVPKKMSGDWIRISKFIYDTFKFGGSCMPDMKYSPGETQEFQMTMIYGGEINYLNENSEETLPALTKLRWRIPHVDAVGYPIKIQKASRSTKFAPIILEPVKPTVQENERVWIYDGMMTYISRGHAGVLDEPLMEGSAFLLDAVISSACVLIEAIMKEMPGISAKDVLDQLINLIGTTQSSNKRNISVKLGSNSKTLKTKMVKYLFYGAAKLKEISTQQFKLDKTEKYQKGNSITAYVASSRSINLFQDTITVGYTIEDIAPGDTGAVYIGKGYGI